MSPMIKPGLIILHGNQLEELQAAVFTWISQYPLNPLEKDIFLVQSNGIAEWLKISLAENVGIYAANRIELPGRFLWTVYRSMLGRSQIPSSSFLDKSPLTWRLMRLLPELLNEPDFVPLKNYLSQGDPERRLQLAARLADLIDLYQMYRSDWLMDWSQQKDVLSRANGDVIALPDDQRWQAKLWRAILQDIPEEERQLGRVNVHRRFIDAIMSGDAPQSSLPRRVILFGVSALPRQSLEALSALSRHTQVILAVPNPCQFYWGDIIDGRDLLLAEHKRQKQRRGIDLSSIPMSELHAHSHPLLASWGKLGRDFIRMLDEFDQEEQTRERFSSLKLDLFTEGEGDHLLSQVQHAIRDLLPLNEHPGAVIDQHDQSIEFHIAHSHQREVEVLHDRLLTLLASEGKSQLAPKEIVVMVPDITTFSASIRAVFGQYKKNDRRFIPFEIADASDRKNNPLLIAVDWLLHLPQQRCLQSEICDLLDVPALAASFGIDEEDLPTIKHWIQGAGIRWGLDSQHRGALGLGAAGEQNSWLFGIERILLGYAVGAFSDYQGIEPYPEISGLDAPLAGALAEFIATLIEWRSLLTLSRLPEDWADIGRKLMGIFFIASTETDRVVITRLHESLARWAEFCDQAQFIESIPLAVFREAWLGGLDETTLNQRFISGGVTFCTFMPMRALPFRVVCLLGMNEGDFPRRANKVDFDLLALPGMARPGDRSRRDDDRYLMLEALLSARDKLYISWVGRNIRDNSLQPPSVLVSQLQDYLCAGWKFDLSLHTTDHPLQPFSARYFFASPLHQITYAIEWGAAHGVGLENPSDHPAVLMTEEHVPPFEIEPDFRLKLSELARFVKQPVAYFFQKRLNVHFGQQQLAGDDEEPFRLHALDEYQLAERLMLASASDGPESDVENYLRTKTQVLMREGLLPIGLTGHTFQEKLVAELTPVLAEYGRLQQLFPAAADKVPFQFEHQGIVLSDWIDHLRFEGPKASESVMLSCLLQTVSKVLDKANNIRPEKLIDVWIRQLAASQAGLLMTVYLVARDVTVVVPPLDPNECTQHLATLMMLWKKGLDQLYPCACKTALALITDKNPQQVYDGNVNMDGEVKSPYLSRVWSDYAALSAHPDWESSAKNLYQPLYDWARQLQKIPFSTSNTHSLDAGVSL